MLLLLRTCNYNVEALLVLGILAAEGQYHQALDKRGVLLIRRLYKKSNSPVCLPGEIAYIVRISTEQRGENILCVGCVVPVVVTQLEGLCEIYFNFRWLQNVPKIMGFSFL